VYGQRSSKKPVYVLISKETFSGGEGFAYDLQAQKRAIIVSEQTDGGAHPGTSYRLHPHFELFIPIGRAINPITKENWEKSGIMPDIPVSPEQALTVAYKMTLTAVAENISNPQSKLLKEIQAALDESGHCASRKSGLAAGANKAGAAICGRSRIFWLGRLPLREATAVNVCYLAQSTSRARTSNAMAPLPFGKTRSGLISISASWGQSAASWPRRRMMLRTAVSSPAATLR